MSQKSFWVKAQGSSLLQGDLLEDCWIPILGEEYGEDDSQMIIPIDKVNLIVLTQSCDLENGKVDLVAMCPIFKLIDFEEINPNFAKKWEEVRKGRIEGLHLLASPTNPENNREALVVDFREIYSLPIGYLKRRATQAESHWRLDSPYLEHFSQSFARFFMRVGLPSAIAPFK